MEKEPVSPESNSSGPEADRKSRRGCLVYSLLLLTVLSLIVIYLFRQLSDRTLGALLVNQLQEQLKTSASLDFQREGFSHFQLNNVELGKDTLHAALLSCESIHLHLRPSRLFKREIALDSLVISGLELSFQWRDSLLLPDWLLQLTASGEVDSSAGSDLTELLAPLKVLADRKLGIAPFIFRLRDTRIRLEGTQQGKKLGYVSPPLGMSFLSPALSASDLFDLSEARLPEQLAAGIQLDWAGSWQDASQAIAGADCPLPLMPELVNRLADASLELNSSGRLSQHLRSGISLERDTLNAFLAIGYKPSELLLNHAGQAIELFDSLQVELTASVPVIASAPRVSLGAALRLPLEGFELDVVTQSTLTPRDSLWTLEGQAEQHMNVNLQLLPAAIQSLLLPLTSLQGEIDGDTRYRLLAGTSGDPVELELAQDLELNLKELALPEEGLQIENLRLGSTTAVQLDPANGYWPLQFSQTLRGDMQLDLSSELTGLNETQGSIAFAQEATGGLEDSLRVSTSMHGTFPELAGLELSSRAALPTFNELAGWLENPALAMAQFPEGFISMMAELPDLSLLDAAANGSARVDLALNHGSELTGSFDFSPNGIWQMDDLVFQLPVMQAAFHSPVLDAQALPPGPLTLELVMAELGELDLFWHQAEEMQSIDLKLRRLRIADLVSQLPAGILPPDVGIDRGLLWAEGALQLDQDFQLSEMDMHVRLAEAEAHDARWRGNGLQLTTDLRADKDSLHAVIHGSLRQLICTRPVWSWEEISLALDTDLRLPAAATLQEALILLSEGADAAAVQRLSLSHGANGFEVTAAIELPSLLDPRGASGQVDLMMDTPMLVQPWPGNHLDGRAAIHLELPAGETGSWRKLEGMIELDLSRLETPDLELAGLHLRLPVIQELRLDGEWPVQVHPGEPRYDWNRLRARQREEIAFDRSVSQLEGWTLGLKRVEASGLVLENLCADLVMAPGRLVCPEFRAELLGGGARGSFQMMLRDNVPFAEMQASLIHLDSRRFDFATTAEGAQAERLDIVLSFSGGGWTADEWEQVRGRIRMPDLAAPVTLNLLRALDEQGIDPSIGRIRKLLSLPGFRYRVESVDFDVDHGFVRPQVALRKGLFSPLPDVAIPMSPLPVRYLLDELDVTSTGEDTP